METVRRQMAYNFSPRTQKIEYIVIHDTGNPAAGADADANYRYFNTGDRGSSADYFVDDCQIVQANDYTKYYSWHCGDGHGKYGITNGNSVGIEICINQDGCYKRAVTGAVELTRLLMKSLGIDAAHVVRHYDASRKNCPASMCKNDWAAWTEFKARIAGEDEELMSKEYDEIMKKLESMTGIINTMGGEIQTLKEKSTPMIYNYIDENLPEWAKPTVKKLADAGALKGGDTGLGLDDAMLRILVINDRMGLYDKD